MRYAYSGWDSCIANFAVKDPSVDEREGFFWLVIRHKVARTVHAGESEAPVLTVLARAARVLRLCCFFRCVPRSERFVGEVVVTGPRERERPGLIAVKVAAEELSNQSVSMSLWKVTISKQPT